MGVTGHWLRMLRLTLLAGCLLVLGLLLTAEESAAAGDAGLPSAVVGAPPATTPARPVQGATPASSARAVVDAAARTGAAAVDARPSAERAVPAVPAPETSSTRPAGAGHSRAAVPSRPESGVREAAEPVTVTHGSATTARRGARAAEAALAAAEPTADEADIYSLTAPVTSTAQQISASTLQTAQGATVQVLDTADALSSTLNGVVRADLATVLQGQLPVTGPLPEQTASSPGTPAMSWVSPSAASPFPVRSIVSGTGRGPSASAVTAMLSAGAGAPMPGPGAPHAPASSESPGVTGSGSGGLATGDLGEGLALPELISLLPGWAHDRFAAGPGPRPSFRPE